MDVKAPVPNVPLFRKVLEHLRAHPEEWDQMHWTTLCGTQACFAGWALHFSGHELQAHEVENRCCNTEFVLDGEVMTACESDAILNTAAEELGLTNWQARNLFAGMNTMQKLEELVEDYTGERL